MKARLGSFETISAGGRKSAIQALGQFEQFRFALGTAMGKSDLRLDPPIRIVVFANAKEMAAEECAGIRQGRDHQMACTVAEGQLAPELVRELTRRLLVENFGSLPPATERALETFFGTVQSTGVHVTWGTPPPSSERTREWALLHRLIVQPDYSGRAHIYLHNLAQGMDSNGAIRSLSEDPAKFNAEVDRYFATGKFESAAGPSRPLNPDRDFSTTNLTSEEGKLARADLLNRNSADLYQGLLKSAKLATEAHEGLAILAMREKDANTARVHMVAAREAGSRNVVALTMYAGMERDPAEAQEILKYALGLDPNYAPAHWTLGERIDDTPRRIAEWKKAVALAPRNYEWLAKYATLCQDEKQYAEAGRAWLAAAQSAPEPASRDRYLEARAQIDQLRVEDEFVIQRREALMKAAELDRLKSQARRELAELEARANSKPLSKEELDKAVDWDEAHGGEKTSEATLVRSDCSGKQLKLQVKDGTGKMQTYLVPDPSKIEITAEAGYPGEATLQCGGAQKPRKIRITLRHEKELVGIELLR